MTNNHSNCNIVLFQVASRDLGRQQGSFPPLGLMYVGAGVKNTPVVKVSMVDGLIEMLDVSQTAQRIGKRISVAITSGYGVAAGCGQIFPERFGRTASFSIC